MSLAARSAIVMMDTRPAFAHARATPQYPQLAVALNRLYACKHGYDLLYLRMRKATQAQALTMLTRPAANAVPAGSVAPPRG